MTSHFIVISILIKNRKSKDASTFITPVNSFSDYHKCEIKSINRVWGELHYSKI